MPDPLTNSEQSDIRGVTSGHVIDVLQEADGYLSLVGYRYRDTLPSDIASECVKASTRCRSLIHEIEERRS